MCHFATITVQLVNDFNCDLIWQLLLVVMLFDIAWNILSTALKKTNEIAENYYITIVLLLLAGRSKQR